MSLFRERIHSPVTKYIISSLITLLVCAVLVVQILVLRHKNAAAAALAEDRSVECVMQSEQNNDIAELLKPEHESDILYQAALEKGYISDEDFVFKSRN